MNFDTPFAQQDEWEFSQWAALVNNMRRPRAIRYLEIGSCMGHSLALMTQYARVERAVAVDLGYIMEGETRIETGAILRTRANSLLSPVRVILGDSHDPATLKAVIEAGPYDVVFIDGDHSYGGALADWQSYGTLAPMVGFHDIACMATHVPMLWREISREHRTISIVNPDCKGGYSLGIGAVFR